MTEAETPQLVSGYLADLDRELADVPAEVRQGIVAGIAEELQGLDAASAASRIDSLGDPAFIAAEARAGAEVPTANLPAATQTAANQAVPTSATPRLAPPRASEKRWYVVVTTVLLEFGGLVVPLAGWVAGIMLLWASPLWTRREKLIATTAPAAVGLVLFGLLALVGSDFAVWHALTLVALGGTIIASIVIGIVLSRRAWDRAR
ncbi:hypothetical protein F1C58_03760 [Glaciihabitans sp. INWT7]|uniref:HAAS signaling domain-containing protein n=1 Tax=Glaciihabitans sp. INWT7 TaxID=2596912 RepID=UPI001626AC99|nr:hypothetical protein [Glaciihabitans sp. INWT7]QNE46114.1 hypothetical protein F1C58_03760 [Glaciihabitans sp. INWT7]